MKTTLLLLMEIYCTKNFIIELLLSNHINITVKDENIIDIFSNRCISK